MTLIKTKKFWALAVLAVVLLYPFQSTVVNRTSVLVVTEDSKLVQGARVRQSWQHYSLESEGHEEDLLTNESTERRDLAAIEPQTGELVFRRQSLTGSRSEAN